MTAMTKQAKVGRGNGSGLDVDPTSLCIIVHTPVNLRALIGREASPYYY